MNPAISRRSLLLGAAGATAVGSISAPPSPAVEASGHPRPPQESLVFQAGHDGLEVFHVFGLTTTVAGSVLAFAEARLQQHDASPHHLAMRRSSDGGSTWDPIRYVRASDGVQSFVNPTPLVDRTTGRIHLFSAECFKDAGNAGGSPDSSRLSVMSSDDDGETWSDPIDLTALFEPDPNGRRLHMPGPGHGICLSDGRLMMQVWHRREIAFAAAERRYGVSVIVSSDGGVTWAAGGEVPLDAAYPLNEARLLERPDGSLVIFGRYASGGTHPRIVSHSSDGGANWSPAVLDAAARPVNAIDTGIARITGGGEPSRIVFSRTDSPGRRNMSVSISYDEGMTWPFTRVLTEGPASYSDAVALPGGRIGVLYGREHQPGVTTSFSRDIVFTSFDLAWLTAGADNGGAHDVITFEVESMPLTSTPELAVATAADPASSGGRRIEAMATDYGQFVEVAMDVPRGGRYDVHVRFAQLPNGGVIVVDLDDRRLGGPIDTSTLSVHAMKSERLGQLRLKRGTHRVRFTVVDKQVDASGLRFSPDLISLAPAV
ncbi:exo-alpha-sialidase [Agromyces laixinhei]|uniref:exo-alpha-sialidase n=1 Tax=Agromyces laixinhei TaxID=2585717 RepID=UPI001E5DC8F6|nr:exo-alpha-sialidase [Agromyces laixinhei]